MSYRDVYPLICFLISSGGCLILYRLTKKKYYLTLFFSYITLIGVMGVLFLISNFN